MNNKSRQTGKHAKKPAAMMSSPLFLQALEPRVLLDAAAAQTAQEVAHQAPHPAPAPAEAADHANLVAALTSVQGNHKTGVEAPVRQAPDVTPKAIYFIDRSVENADKLSTSIPKDAEIHFIDQNVNGVQFIAQTLQGRSNVESVHIISHGEEGVLQVGNASLSRESMQSTYKTQLANIGHSLNADADILVYGCDFGAGVQGAAAVETLSQLTGADVAASTDDTGAAKLGGDWVLERSTGTIETRSLDARDWDGLLVAPVLDATPALTYAATEDASAPVNGSNVGVLVSDYTGGITDVDPGALKGIAITANVPTQGVWWYTLDGGTNWQTVGTVSTTSALLLADNANTRLYFQATTANFNGAVTGTALTFKAWDQSSGTAGAKASTTTGTGNVATAVSLITDTVAVNVAAVNDAPVLTDVARTLTTFNEDANILSPVGRGAVGIDVTLATLNINNGNVSDVDTGAVKGIAIVGANTANGTWWYSTDNGTTWTQFGTVSETNALLLSNATTSRVYFQSTADFNGTLPDALTLRAWDQTQGTNGARFNIAANGTGGTTAFSAATDVVAQTITAVVDITADTITTPEDTTVIVDIFANDTFENTGRTITAVNGTAIALNGSVAVTNGTVTLINDAGQQKLSFTPAADYSGSAVFNYTVTSGGATETANVTVTITAVADAPRIDLDSTTAGSSYSAYYDQGPMLIGKLITLTDPENNNITSVTITLAGATAADTLTAGEIFGITNSYNATTGVLTLSGNSTLANYQTLLNSVLFTTTSGTPNQLRTITVSAVSGTAPVASNVATASITILDSDGDGVANLKDIDDDNDGILDTIEGTGSSLVNGGAFSGSTAPPGWYYGADPFTSTASPAYSYGLPNSHLVGGLFDQLNPGGNPDLGLKSIVQESEGATPAVYYHFQQPLAAGTYLYSFDLSARLSAPADFYKVSLYNRDTQTIVQVLANGSISTLPDMNAAGDNYQNFSGSVNITTPGNYVLLFQINPNGVGNGDYLIDRVAFGVNPDVDNDGVVNRLDLDSDNDGITDNVEAQSTAGYIAPSGIDADLDGLDDAYDAAIGNQSSAASIGLTPVDTDSDGTSDYLDGDSDGDGLTDIIERGDGQPTSLTSTTDTDGDGLLDIFEGTNVNDGFDANDENILPNGNFNLADTDNDVAANGAGAIPRIADFDYRDDPQAPVNTLPVGWSLPEDTGGQLTGISVSDNGANGTYIVQLTVASGMLSAIADSSVTVTGSGTGTLTLSGSLAAINAFLGGASAPTYTPVVNYNGPVNLQIVTKDGGGGSGSLSDTDNVTITVTPVNDAPVVDATPVLTYTAQEDAPPPVNGTAVGVPISDFTAGISDVDAGALKGIAITATAPTNGVWWYTLDGGSTWQAVGTVSNTSALLLADNANTRLYFQATTLNYNGTGGATALTFRGWDQTSGTAGSKVTTATNGGITAFSSATETIAVTVAPVNDAPVLTDVARTLTTFNEDANILSPVGRGAVGIDVTLATLNINNGNVSDVDTGAVKGIAIVGANTANGTWWYSTDNGTTWTQFGTVSETNALLLSNATTSRIYFQSTADFNGTLPDALTLRAWDQTQGTNGARFNIAANGTGGTTAFSAATDVVAQTITAVADIVANTSGNTTLEDTTIVVDVLANDTFENAGRAITAIDGQAIALNGSVAVANGTVTLINDAGQQKLSFTPAADYSGNATFSYTVTSGGVTETANVTVTITAVADAPRIDLDTSAPGSNYAANYDQGAVPIGLIASVTDPEGNNLTSMTITLSNPTAADNLYLTSAVAGITVTAFNPATGVLLLTGNTTLANYQLALNNVRFASTNGTAAVRNITVTAISSVAPTASNVATATLTPLDSDGDGIVNAVDIDDDNDGIIDTVEGNGLKTVSPNSGTASATPTAGWSIEETIDGIIAPNDGTNGYHANYTGHVDLIQYTFTQPQTDVQYIQIYNNVGNALADGQGIQSIGEIRLYAADGSILRSITGYSTPGSIPDNSQPFQIYVGGVNGVARIEFIDLTSWSGQFGFSEVNILTGSDTDGDGRVNRLDLDSDNDGITDNVEAQTTAGYIAPSGIDANGDGLDDAYDLSGTELVTNGTFTGSIAGWTTSGSVIGASDVIVFNSSNTTPNGEARQTITTIPGETYTLTFNVGRSGAGTNTVGLNVQVLDGTTVLGSQSITKSTNTNTGYSITFVATGTQTTIFLDDITTVTTSGDVYADNFSVQRTPGLTPVDTDGDGNADYTDLDSDNDGKADITERGDGQPTSVTSAADTDGDGLLDIFEGSAINDGFDPNDDNINASGIFNLADSDNDTAADGSNAQPPTRDLDYRDSVSPIPPVVTDPGIPGQNFNATTGNYTATTGEDTSFNGQVKATDVDGDPLTYTVTTQPAHGTVTLNATTGAYTYTPIADYNGSDSFVVQISDGNGGVVQSTVTFTVTPVADIVADTATTSEDTAVNITVNANDTFENAGHVITAINGTAVTVGVPLAVANGSVTLNANGTLGFTPAANFNGPASFSYTVTSGGVTETASVTVNVTPVNDAPVPTDPGLPGQTFNPGTGNYAATTAEDVPFTGQVTATDADGDTLGYTITTQPAHGTVTLNATTGAYTYTPTADYNGTDSFVVQVSDGNGGVVQSTVNFTVTPVADIVADTVSTSEDTPVIITVNANDSFENSGHVITAINGTAVTVGVPLAVANGSVTLNANGTLGFTPAANFNG
ncbi:tandem-95 repeat protein, partial [Enterobacteriaceae bacterium H16N7]|nr:tandem-95 repeat protein [Dryocola clanedunensis]